VRFSPFTTCKCRVAARNDVDSCVFSAAFAAPDDCEINAVDADPAEGVPKGFEAADGSRGENSYFRVRRRRSP
jgi:hypothetical protein